MTGLQDCNRHTRQSFLPAPLQGCYGPNDIFACPVEKLAEIVELGGGKCPKWPRMLQAWNVQEFERHEGHAHVDGISSKSVSQWRAA